MIWSHSPYVYQEENEERKKRIVRFRTVGDMSCTAAVDSYAATISSGRREGCQLFLKGARIDDKRSEAAMEKRKQQGYFFRMKFLKLFFLLLFSTGVKRKQKKR
jgi:sulfate adenylyltransferase subunit 2